MIRYLKFLLTQYIFREFFSLKETNIQNYLIVIWATLLYTIKNILEFLFCTLLEIKVYIFFEQQEQREYKILRANIQLIQSY